MIVSILKTVLVIFQVFAGLSFAALAVVLFEEQVLLRIWNPVIRVPWWGAAFTALIFFLGAYFLISR